MKGKDTKLIGNKGENLACDFLAKSGLEIIARNYRNLIGEIDIICREADILVFVEVKTKMGDALGSPEEMVGLRKQKKLKEVAELYLIENELDDNYRIDVVAVDLSKPQPKINWLKSAVEN